MRYFCVLIVMLFSHAKSQIDVEKLVESLDDTELCGQMTQVTFKVIQMNTKPPSGQNPIDLNKLKIALENYKVGSILNTPFDEAEKAQVWQEIIRTIHETASKANLKIPVLFGIDSIHGANYIQEATLFPQPISIAASFNAEIAMRIGELTARETRAVGIPWNFNPVLDIGRQPLWPRIYETFGEDVYVASQMGYQYIKGHQGNGDLKNRSHAATCLKHYIGYSYPLNGKDRSVAWIPENILREYFLPPFESGVLAGSPTVMINSGDVNGLPGHANYQYLTEILRGELGFDGFTVSDWEDIIRLHTRDRLAETPEDAVRLGIMSGVDMSMVPFDFSFHDHCMSLVKKDSAFRTRAKQAVKRIVSVKNQLGLFENRDVSESDLQEIASQEANDLNLRAARESIILAKNEANVLPLKKQSRILLTGPTANLIKVLNGGWSYTWQGDREELFQINGKEKKTIFGALTAKTLSLSYEEGANFTHTLNLNQVTQNAGGVDFVILCIGEPTYTETPGNIENLEVSESQEALANAVFAANKPVIVVYVGGRPRIITKIVEKAQAVLIALLPGNKGADAIADILYGDFNPSARMPITYHRSPNSFVTYDHKPLEEAESLNGLKYDPLFKFGHGLSYTSFSYSSLKLNSSCVNPPNGVGGSVTVLNTGNRAGQEVVLIYLNDEYGQVSRPVRQLKFFTKITLEPGQSKVVNFEIPLKELSFIGIKNKRIWEKGYFNVYVDTLKERFYLDYEETDTGLEQNSSSIIRSSLLMITFGLLLILNIF